MRNKLKIRERFLRRFKRGGQPRTQRPWVKYALRGRPSSAPTATPTTLERIRSLFFDEGKSKAKETQDESR